MHKARCLGLVDDLFPPALLFAPALGEQQAAALRRDPLHFAFELLSLAALDAFLFLGGRRYPHGGQGMRVASHVAVQAQGQLFGVTLVVVDALVVLVQADGLDDDVFHAQLHQLTVQDVAEGTGFVATVDGLGQDHLRFDPRQELGRRKLLRRLRGAVVQDAHHHDGVGVDVQAQLDGLILLARGLLRANFGGIEVLFVHNVGGCSASALARQLLMSSLPQERGRHA